MTVRSVVTLVGAIALLGAPPAGAAPSPRLVDFHEVPMIVPDPPALPAIGPSPDPPSPSPSLGFRLPGMRNAPAGPAPPGGVTPLDPSPLPIRLGYTVEWETGPVPGWGLRDV